MLLTHALSFLWLLPSLALGACLTRPQYQSILSRWVSVFEAMDPEVARGLMTPNIKYWSDSNDFIFGSPPGSLTGNPFWASRAELINGVTQNQENDDNSIIGKVKFSVLQSSFGCGHIVFHWRNDARSKGQIPGSTNVRGDPVGFGGIDYLFIDTTSSPKKIKTAYSEYNLGELLFTSGFKICFQKNNDTACA